MKNKIAIASAFLAASSFSMGEIVVNDFLSFEGFVDSSYSHTELIQTTLRVMALQTASKSIKLKSAGCSTSTLSLRKSIFSMKVTMKAEDGDDGELVEQAFVNYALGNGDVITAGRYASMLGFEAFEPTGLYQFSTAYSASGLPGYAQGVKFTRESNTSFFGLSIQDEAFDNVDSALVATTELRQLCCRSLRTRRISVTASQYSLAVRLKMRMLVILTSLTHTQPTKQALGCSLLK